MRSKVSPWSALYTSLWTAETFGSALSLLKHLEVAEPVFVSLTLVGVKGMVMALPEVARHWNYQSDPFDRDVIIGPDMLVQKLEEGFPYPSTLLPIANAVWQAAGREKTPYTGEWKVGREDEL